MITVKITTNFPYWPLIRQTPRESGQWEDCRFFINQEISECDYWFVIDGLLKEESVNCPLENTYFITLEPQTVKQYNSKFLGQFSQIITSHTSINHPKIIKNQQGQPWMVGCSFVKETKSWQPHYTKNYDELINSDFPLKTKELSIIMSGHKKTDGHIRRKKFVDILKNHFKDRLDIFGVNIKEIPDKWDGLAPYKYYLAIENSSFSDYWTEKISDSFLAGSYPFYYGCPNIYDYFPKESLTMIDINKPNEAIKIIEHGIKNNLYDKNAEVLKIAKEMVLNKYNLFNLMASQCNDSKNIKIRVSLKPENSYLQSKNSFINIFKKYGNSKLFKKIYQSGKKNQ